jgi:hypothetical protein
MMIIWFKDNLSFIYNTMESIRKEIEDELKRTRLDKTRLYNLLLKIIDGGVGGGEGAQGPAGPRGPAGPAGAQGPAGPAGECKCKCTKEEATPAPVKTEAPKKTTTATKKKTTTTKKATTA